MSDTLKFWIQTPIIPIILSIPFQAESPTLGLRETNQQYEKNNFCITRCIPPANPIMLFRSH
jgi:hypothetical protein